MILPRISGIEYSYWWPGITGPRATAVDRGREVDRTPVAITDLTVTEFPGTDEPPSVHAKGRVLTMSGAVDKRRNTTALCWVDEDEILAAHAVAKATL